MLSCVLQWGKVTKQFASDASFFRRSFPDKALTFSYLVSTYGDMWGCGAEPSAVFPRRRMVLLNI